MKRSGVVFATVVVGISLTIAPVVQAGSAAEDGVTKVVQEIIEARYAGNVEKVLSYVADDAVMESYAGKKMTKAEFGEAVRRNIAKAAPSSEFEVRNKIVGVRLVNDRRAVVLIDQSGVVIVNPEKGKDQFGATKRIEHNQFEWTLENRAGTWLIVGQKWTMKN